MKRTNHRPVCVQMLLGILWMGLNLSVLGGMSADLEAQTPLTVTLTREEQAWLATHPTIRLAPDPEFRPIEFFDEHGNYAGIAADYASLIGQKLGITFEIMRCANWDEVIARMQRREVDVLGNVVKTPQREAFMRFPTPYLTIPSVIIVRKNVERNLTLDMLQGMNIVMPSGYGYVDIIRNKYPQLKIDLTADLKTALRKVSFGLADAFVGDLATASYYIEAEGITNLQVAGETEPANISGFGVRSDWPELSHILEKGVALMTEAEQQAIYRKWIRLETQPGLTMQEFRNVMLIVIGVIGVVVGGILLWNRALTRMVRLRTEALQRELTERKRAEDGLAREHNLLRTLIDHLPDYIYFKDADSRFLLGNLAVAHIMGAAAPEDLIGKTDFDFYPEEFAAQYYADERAVIQSGRPQVNREELVINPTGQQTWILTTQVPLRDPQGTIMGLVGIGRDINERKRVEEELEQYRHHLEDLVNAHTAEFRAVNAHLRQEIAEHQRTEETLSRERHLLRMLIDNLPDHIYVKDVQCRFLLANQAVTHTLGATTPDELIGKTDFDFSYPPGLAEQYYADEQVVITSGQPMINREEPNLDRDAKTTKWFLTTKIPFWDSQGNIIGILGIARDITERKREAEELRKHRDHLAERTAELQASLETLKRAQKQLVEAEKMAALGALVAGIAHEINTPVGIGVTAASYLELQTHKLAAQYAANDLKRSELEQYLKMAGESAAIILSNLNRAAQLIKSFKQVAVDRSTEAKRRFRLKDYLEDVLLSLTPKLRHTQHTLTLTCPETIVLDSYPDAFFQIFTNFVMNSLIHGFEHHARGVMRLDVTPADALLRLRYTDNGKGMTPAELVRIFEPFYTTKRGQGGSGLGLHIVYNLVTQKLKGQIRCESAPEVGTTFIVELPLE